MKIVILDGYTGNPGDLSWEGFEKLGELTVWDRTSSEEVRERIKDAEIIISNKTKLTSEVFDAFPKMRYLGVLATGYNIVDLEAADRHHVTVTNIPAYSTATVAQHTIALLLELCNHVGQHNASVQEGNWSACRDFCYWETPIIELDGKTMGLIGFGNIARAVARVAEGLGMNIVAYCRHPDRTLENERIHFASLEELYAVSDVISLHCPLTEQTRGMICRESIAKMKDGVLLLNTARGPLVVERDLREALESGKIGGAGVDVASREPIQPDNPLLGAKNCIITPHIAWAAKEARARLIDIAVKNVEAFLAGRPVNVVNHPNGK